jgi:putative addiction module component (TIGR02574 family)
MGAQELLEQALKLTPDERFALADEVLHSLDRPDPAIDRLWLDVAEQRLAAYRAGRVKGIPAEAIFGEIE